MPYPIIRIALKPFISLWVKEAKGIENLPHKGAAILAANHSSYLDHLIIGYFLLNQVNRKFHFLSKKEHFDGALSRAWHTHVGAIPIDREKKGKKALRMAIKALDEQKIIVLYPEGTRTLDGKLQRAKTGIARLALASGAPVIPIGLIGTFEILPKGKNIPRFRRASISIGKPIYFDDYYNKKMSKKILRQATNKIMKEIAKLSNKKYAP